MHIIRNVANNEKWLLVVNKISLHVKKKKNGKFFSFTFLFLSHNPLVLIKYFLLIFKFDQIKMNIKNSTANYLPDHLSGFLFV